MALRRLVQAYNQAAATLNLLRGFSTGGYAGLQRVTQWNLDFMDKSDEGQVRTKSRIATRGTVVSRTGFRSCSCRRIMRRATAFL